MCRAFSVFSNTLICVYISHIIYVATKLLASNAVNLHDFLIQFILQIKYLNLE